VGVNLFLSIEERNGQVSLKAAAPIFSGLALKNVFSAQPVGGTVSVLEGGSQMAVFEEGTVAVVKPPAPSAQEGLVVVLHHGPGRCGPPRAG